MQPDTGLNSMTWQATQYAFAHMRFVRIAGAEPASREALRAWWEARYRYDPPGDGEPSTAVIPAASRQWAGHEGETQRLEARLEHHAAGLFGASDAATALKHETAAREIRSQLAARKHEAP
jgi:hypothetical protein